MQGNISLTPALSKGEGDWMAVGWMMGLGGGIGEGDWMVELGGGGIGWWNWVMELGDGIGRWSWRMITCNDGF